MKKTAAKKRVASKAKTATKAKAKKTTSAKSSGGKTSAAKMIASPILNTSGGVMPNPNAPAHSVIRKDARFAFRK